jgi:diguanylate cyclase
VFAGDDTRVPPRAETADGRRSAARGTVAGLFAVLGVALVLYLVLPLGDDAANAWYLAIAAGGVALGCWGLRHHRPRRRAPWVLTLAGYAGWLVGDAIWSVGHHLTGSDHIWPAEAVYLLAYLVLGAGAVAFVRPHLGGRDLAALLDASIVTAGAGIVVVAFVVAPVAADSTLSPAMKLTATAYPLADLFLLGVIARLVAAPGARTAAFRLLAGSLTAVLVADAAWNLDLLGTGVSERWEAAAWLVGYLLLGAAAWAPSMRGLSEPAPVRSGVRLGRRRVAALSGGLMLPGVTLLADGATGGGVHWLVVGTGSLVLSGLVLVRMVGLLHTVSVQSERLAELARSDSLTGAPNRRTWDAELDRAARLGRELRTTLSVAILDLDHFKAFNDEHGHQAGDALLREAVAAWTAALPPGAMLARYGGEEFTVLMPATSPEAARHVVLGLREVTPLGATFSAGVAACTPGADPAAALAQADEALYQAKRDGRDRVVVHGGGRPARTPATTAALAS